MGLSIPPEDARREREQLGISEKTGIEAVLVLVLRILYEYMVIGVSTAAGVLMDAKMFGGLAGGTLQGVVDVLLTFVQDHPWKCLVYILADQFSFTDTLCGRMSVMLLILPLKHSMEDFGEMCITCLFSQLLTMEVRLRWQSNIILRSALGLFVVFAVFMGERAYSGSYKAALNFASNYGTAIAAATGVSTFMWHLKELVEQRRAEEIADVGIDLVIDVLRCVCAGGMGCCVELVLSGAAKWEYTFKRVFVLASIGMVCANLVRAFMWQAAIKNRRAEMLTNFFILAVLTFNPRLMTSDTSMRLAMGGICVWLSMIVGAYRPPVLRRTIGRVNLKLFDMIYGRPLLLRLIQVMCLFGQGVHVRAWFAGVSFTTLLKQYFIYRIIIVPLATWAGLLVEECTADPAKRSVNGCTASLLVSGAVAIVIALWWPVAEVVAAGMHSWFVVLAAPLQASASLGRWKDVMRCDHDHRD